MGLKDYFETAMVHEPSVFEPLKFYCIPSKKKKAVLIFLSFLAFGKIIRHNDICQNVAAKYVRHINFPLD